MRQRKKQEFHTIRHSDFIKNLQKIILDGVPAQAKVRPDLAIGESFRQQFNHLEFPSCK